MRRNKDLASLFELQETTLRGVVSATNDAFEPVGSPETIEPGIGVIVIGTPVTRTTLPGGGQRGDATAASFEYGDELEN